MNEELLAQLARLHGFWFALADDAQASQLDKRWFMSTPEFDQQLKDNFADLPDMVAGLDPAKLADDARIRVAAVIALDQLPRNLYRGSARAFAYDKNALELARGFIAAGLLEKLAPFERLFVLMPYQHVEDLALQQEGLAHFERFVAAVKDAGADAEMAQKTMEAAEKHVAIIERFGRFPHRNAALGRKSTPEEEAYLADGGERFGQ